MNPTFVFLLIKLALCDECFYIPIPNPAKPALSCLWCAFRDKMGTLYLFPFYLFFALFRRIYVFVYPHIRPSRLPNPKNSKGHFTALLTGIRQQRRCYVLWPLVELLLLVGLKSRAPAAGTGGTAEVTELSCEVEG